MKKLTLLLAGIMITLGLFAQKNISADDILKMIDNGQAVKIENATITGDLNLSKIQDKERIKKKGISNGNDVYECHVQVPLHFRNCTFKGQFIGYLHEDWSDELYNAMFHESVSFEGCVFEKEFLVKYSEFAAAANFPGNTFKAEALFKYTEFSGNVDFSKSIFEEEANFKYAEFPDKSTFANSKFEEEANFKYTEFEEDADFSGSYFDDDATFKYTE